MDLRKSSMSSVKEMEERISLLERKVAEMQMRVQVAERSTKPKPVAFTPGPWSVGSFSNDGVAINADGGERRWGNGGGWYSMAVAYGQQKHPLSEAIAMANARLIAEAPAMFDVLLELREDDNWDSDYVEEIIKRVRGQHGQV